jgi:hypothetical protein
MPRPLYANEIPREVVDKLGIGAVMRGARAPSRWGKAERTGVDGITFASKTEALLWRFLRATFVRSVIIRQPIFDLWVLSNGKDAPPIWRPDFLLIADTAQVHEAKGRKGLDSRDYILRRKAFEASYPRIAVVEWRMERGRLEETYDTRGG